MADFSKVFAVTDMAGRRMPAPIYRAVFVYRQGGWNRFAVYIQAEMFLTLMPYGLICAATPGGGRRLHEIYGF
ncbi:MAG: hypothetical protein ACOZBW_05420, partial [Thermodesulfobacteriota bacterium]